MPKAKEKDWTRDELIAKAQESIANAIKANLNGEDELFRLAVLNVLGYIANAKILTGQTEES